MKIFEIRDMATCIVCIGIPMIPKSADERRLMQHGGYRNSRYILFGNIRGGQWRYDPYEWTDRTYALAHQHIEKSWDSLETGDVIDIEFILGESTEKKVSEIR